MGDNMACCGGKRAALSERYRSSWNRQPEPLQAAAAPVGVNVLRYVGAEPLSLGGPYSGRVYSTGETGSAIHVDPVDVPALLAPLLFVREEARSWL